MDFDVLRRAVEMVESGGRADAVSPKGAIGPMQTMPGTLRDPGFGIRPAIDSSVEELRRVGTEYLRAMLDRYQLPELALAAYNWGPGNVDRLLKASGGDPKVVLAAAPRETRNYVPAVLQRAGQNSMATNPFDQFDEAPAAAAAPSANPFDQFDEAPAQGSPFADVSASVDTTAEKVRKPLGPMAQMIVGAEAKPAPVQTSTREMAARAAEAGIQVPEWLLSPVERTEQALRSARQGASFGFADELQGAVTGALPALVRGEDVGEAYRRERDRERALQAQYQEEQPGAAVASQLGGGLLGGTGPAGAVRAAPSLVGRIGRGMATGTGFGLLGGAGVSEEENVTGVARDAATGGISGGLIGGALPIVTTLGGAGINATRNLLSPKTGPAAEEAAARAVSGAMQRGNTTTDDVRQILAQQADLSAKPEMLVDLAGNPAQRQLYAARVAGGPGANDAVRDVVERAASGGQRASQDVQKAVAQRGTSLNQLEQAVAKRRATADKLYTAAYKHGVVRSPEVQQILDDPAIQPRVAQAFARSREAAALRGEQVPELFGEAGRIRPPTVQDIHTLKRQLDADITSAYKSGDGNLGGALKQVRSRLMGALEQEVPAYRNAAKVYRGDLEFEEALESGRTMALNRPVDELRSFFSKLPTAEKEAFRAGAIDSILAQKVDRATDTGDFARRLWGNADMRQRLTLLGQTPEKIEVLAREMKREGRMQGTYQSLMGNSATAMRQQDVQDLEGDIASQMAATIWQTFGRGDYVGGVRMAGSAVRDATRGLRGETADAVAKMLTAQGPDEIRATLSKLDAAQQRAAFEAVQRYQSQIAGTAAVAGAGPVLTDD